MTKFKIRASATSKIMTNPRAKKDQFSATALSHVQEWAIQHVAGAAAPMRSKYTEKGILVESDAIQFACDFFKWGFADKNEQFFEDDYRTGTPDVLLHRVIADIKSSWNISTFPYFAELDPKYWMQMQSYMTLLKNKGIEVNHAEVIYCLMNAPDHMIDREAWAIAREAGRDEMEQDDFELAMSRLTFDHLPNRLRIKRYTVEYDADFNAEVEQRVSDLQPYAEECLNVLDNLNQ